MKRVTAAVLIKNKKVLIAKRNSKDPLANLWEFPGGKIEAGETPEECLKREIKEELHIDVAVGEFFTESIYRYEAGSIQLLAYLASWNGEGHLEKIVHDDIAWADKESITNYKFAPADIPIVEKLRDLL